MRVITVANRKGGVGKTTLTLNLAAELAERGKRVLVVDLDEQCNLTDSLLRKEKIDVERTCYQLLMGNHVQPKHVRVSVSIGGRRDKEKAGDAPECTIDLIPGSDAIKQVEDHFAINSVIAWERKLANKLNMVSQEYDFAILDCPPALGRIVVNALVAADEILIPVKLDKFSYSGTVRLLKRLKEIAEDAGAKGKIAAIVPNIYNQRLRHQRDYLEAFTKLGKQLDIPLAVAISDTTRVSEALSAQLPLLSFDRSTQASSAYEALAERMMEMPYAS